MQTSVKLDPGEELVTVTRALFLPIPKGWVSASGYKKYGIWWGVYRVARKIKSTR